MNLSISPVTSNYKSAAPSFGMARFSEKGLKSAVACSDVYTPLATPNDYDGDSVFCKKKGFGPAPFTKYVKETLNAGTSAEQIGKIKKTIEKCGTSDNAITNANFAKQLVATKSVIDKLPDEPKKKIAESALLVFDKNYNNPELSKKDTIQLLELSKPALDDKQYLILTGVLQKCDEK